MIIILIEKFKKNKKFDTSYKFVNYESYMNHFFFLLQIECNQNQIETNKNL